MAVDIWTVILLNMILNIIRLSELKYCHIRKDPPVRDRISQIVWNIAAHFHILPRYYPTARRLSRKNAVCPMQALKVSEINSSRPMCPA